MDGEDGDRAGEVANADEHRVLDHGEVGILHARDEGKHIGEHKRIGDAGDDHDCEGQGQYDGEGTRGGCG